MWLLYVTWWLPLQPFKRFNQSLKRPKTWKIECLYLILDPSICFFDILLFKFWKWHGCKKFCGAPVWSLESKEAITIFQIYSPRQAPGINWIYIPASRPPDPGHNTTWGEGSNIAGSMKIYAGQIQCLQCILKAYCHGHGHWGPDWVKDRQAKNAGLDNLFIVALSW